MGRFQDGTVVVQSSQKDNNIKGTTLIIQKIRKVASVPSSPMLARSILVGILETHPSSPHQLF
jgi:hypothetical protein